MKILLTGGAGFIGFHVAKALLERRDEIVIVDNLNDYYDVLLKKDRLKELEKSGNYVFEKCDISDHGSMNKIFLNHKFDKIIHLAAQAGVRYSLENPFAYGTSNLTGTLVMLEMARQHNIKDFVYASSSSVYGDNKKVPFSEKDNVDNPISLYAATKKSNELMAHVYSHLYGINCTGLRFFTVYGPWGRPDMALFKFTKAIIEGESIDVYNNGELSRDFTYITDIVEGVLSAVDNPVHYTIYNLGGDDPIQLDYFIECIEESLGRKAKKNMMPMQPGDVEKTMADITLAKEKLGFEPKIKIKEGIKKFVEWYKSYYQTLN